MSHTTTRIATRPVPIGELLDAWVAVQRGDFRHHPAPEATGSAGTGRVWRRAPGEVPVLVAGCAGQVGASTVALLLAGAAMSGRVVDCAPASCSGLAGASTAELGEAGDGWLAGRRDTVRIERRRDQCCDPALLPSPLPGEPGRVTVVDAWWEPRQLLDATGWLADLARTCPRVVLVARATVPGVARLEAAVNLFGPERCWAVVAGPRRWPQPVERSLGARTRQLQTGGRLFALPSNPALALSGITTEPLPRTFEARARQLVEGLLP